jgi:hypothetical protein
LRSLAHAAFLTPAGHAFRTSCLAAISTNVTYIDQWRTDPKQKLGTLWDWSPTDVYDLGSGTAGMQHPVWEDHYLIVEVHKAAAARLLSGASQTAIDALASWLVLGPVRWVNEQPNGGWRFIPYSTTLGSDPVAINSQPTWAQERNRVGNHSDTPASVSGSWMTYEGSGTSYSQYSSNTSSGAYYPSYFWAALAMAVERGVSGAGTAWQTVQANITNLSSWRQGFGTDPRWGVAPR